MIDHISAKIATYTSRRRVALKDCISYLAVMFFSAYLLRKFPETLKYPLKSILKECFKKHQLLEMFVTFYSSFTVYNIQIT